MSEKDKAIYIHHLLKDIEALEIMLDKNLFEKEPVRIGAEQEFCLVNNKWYPANNAQAILNSINDPHFTHELAKYNLEINLDPLILGGTCFSELHRKLREFLIKADKKAGENNSKVVLTGILPTITTRHLSIDYMTPLIRYEVLNETIKEIRKKDINLHIKGVDEVKLLHDSVLFEGCNTSFQSHLQIAPDDFVKSYNWAQAIAGPVLSICTNSPLLLGKELWSETRIALFAQSMDTRASSFYLNEKDARVSFGRKWAHGSVVEIFKDNITRFKSLLTTHFKSDSVSLLNTGVVPKLKALNLHNGTVYLWNRPCYGVSKNIPHLRIENRYIPSGPSVLDEIANMAFWVGIMKGRPAKYDNIHEIMGFKDVKNNFIKAARYGMGTQFYWNNALIHSHKLIHEELLPIAYKGLTKMKVDQKDIERYLSVIENRVDNKSGSRWMVQSYRNLTKTLRKPDALRAITQTMYNYQQKDYPVDTWKILKNNDDLFMEKEKSIEQVMNTDLYTVNEDDSSELVLSMMLWKNIHHMPVLNSNADLAGLLTWTDVKKHMDDPEHTPKTVRDIMTTNLITITSNVSIEKAREIMQRHKINCLPVVKGEKLIGIITSKDY
ncbi:CBS domain-containing protein [Abyssalbus ytuae]|uniref:CBS domain-containing protein n=1 Tax=Abyssalbus ytuae TaxID=2926907 RepID=A0A9E7CU43_9FLAO|nr:CBS domain-containing protein [Abyssalbus ytuae]UOB19391.1 CBS domain-containing protein [Abyssalbus ytuae]